MVEKIWQDVNESYAYIPECEFDILGELMTENISGFQSFVKVE
jgi:hypothetical protein